MARLWPQLRRSAPVPYDLTRLVDCRWLGDPASKEQGALSHHQQLICDIDKTYLETEFESLTRMVRIAFEAATAKVTVTGASEVLLAARWGHLREKARGFGSASASTHPGHGMSGFSNLVAPRPLHFVSSSPPQLRAVLEEKLMLDGLDWTSDTFKNQAYNLRMGRMDLLRQHVAYKSYAILNILSQADAGTSFYTIGDNAESDAYIYLGLKLKLDGRLSAKGFEAYLMFAGVEVAAAKAVVEKSASLPAVNVADILIRNVPGYSFVAEPPLTDGLRVFDNFFQAALVLMVQGVIASGSLWELARDFHNQHGMSQQQLKTELAHAALATEQLALLSPGSLPTSLAADIASVQVRLEASSGESVHGKGTGPLLPLRPGTAFAALTEAEILRLAQNWAQKITHQKALPTSM